MICDFLHQRQLYPIVTLRLIAPTEAVLPVDHRRRRRRPTTAGNLPPSCVVSVHDESVAVLPVHGRCVKSHLLYSRIGTGGQWMFGRLPTTSVSETAAASTLTSIETLWSYWCWPTPLGAFYRPQDMQALCISTNEEFKINTENDKNCWWQNFNVRNVLN